MLGLSASLIATIKPPIICGKTAFMTSGCPDAAGRVQLIDSNVVAVAWGAAGGTPRRPSRLRRQLQLSGSLDHPSRGEALIGLPATKASARFCSSVAVEAGEPVGVKVRIAKQFLANANPLHEQADVEFVGHADAAVHLDRFLHGECGA